MMRIAIDGPAASGKSAAGSAVAARLGYPFIDTGVIYRALTWFALRQGVTLGDFAGLTALAAEAKCEIRHDATTGTTVTINGLDATPYLRKDEVEQAVSTVSAVPGVREHLVAIQRQLAGVRVVMAGRDIGSVVLPYAELKLFLDASPEERARRRLLEIGEDGLSYDALVTQMRRRDYLDRTRQAAPLKAADGAIHLVTDGMSLAEVVDRMLELAGETQSRLEERGLRERRTPTAGSNG